MILNNMKMVINKIPVYILEEGNENFIVWQYAVNKGMMKPHGNTLIHINEHINMGAPRLKSSIFNINNNLTKIIDFTYCELCINSYIVPAVYLGLFDKIHWIKSLNTPRDRISRKRVIRTFNDEGKKFIVYNPQKEPSRSNVICKKFIFSEDSLNGLTTTNHHNMILDFNLNYFVCIRDPSEYQIQYIEITKNEFDQFNNNFKYHQLKYKLQGNRIETKVINDRFYYVLNDHEEIYANVKYPDKEILVQNIKNTILKLVKLNVKFEIVTITRSLNSGYVPGEIIDFLEEEFIREFKKYFPIEINDIKTLIANLTN